MDLWLLRHAEAKDSAASGQDRDRELTPEGIKRARGVARGLAALDPGIERIYTSPYRRARQTAEAAAEALRLTGELLESRSLEPGQDAEAILSELEASGEWSVLLVGHQPHLGVLLGQLLQPSGGLEIPLKKAAVAKVVREGSRSGTLRALLPAKVLELLGRGIGGPKVPREEDAGDRGPSTRRNPSALRP